MDRLTRPQLTALLDFVRGLYACLDRDAFVPHLLHAISRLIPADSTAYVEVNLGSGKLLETSRVEPAAIEFPGCQQIFEYHIREYPFFTYRQQTGDGRTIKLSDFLTQRQFHRLGLYNEFFRPLDTEYQMTASMAPQWPFVIDIALNRRRRDFSERDRLLLNLVRPHLVQAYQNAQAVTQMQQEATLLQQAVEVSGQGIVVLTRDGRVRLMTQQARAWLTEYFGNPSRQADHLPETLRAWITHQERQFGQADDTPLPRTPLAVERNGARLVVRATCARPNHCLLLLEERQTAVQPASFESFGLTRREAEVLHWVAQGKSNAAIGTILEISVETVRKHLQHIFDKLGVETRTAAAAAVLGPRAAG